MKNNDVLRMFRYALNIPDSLMLNIFKMAECKIDKPQLINLLKKDEASEFVSCSTELLEHFFNGLILYNRGIQFNNQSVDSDDSGLSYLNELNLKSAYSNNDKFRNKDKQTQEKRDKTKTSAISLSNNEILKKIKIALDLKQEDMMEIFRLGKVDITKNELTAFFRKQGHKNYKECGDQYLKKFLQGLGVRHRS